MTGAAADPRALRAELGRVLRGRVVLLGIGNPLRGDDAAGCEVARQVRHMASPALLEAGRVLVLEAEDVPESYSGPVVAADPDVILLLDAVDLGAAAGSVALIPASSLRDVTLYTHRTPLAPLARYLEHRCGADVYLLGIQPASVDWGAPLHPDVAAAARDAAALLVEALGSARGPDLMTARTGPEALA